MMINEIEIHSKQCPNYDDIEELFMTILEINRNDLFIEYTIMDDWCFTNEKKISGIDIENLKNKIYTVEIYENKNSKGIMHIEKVNDIYHIDMYVRHNIFKNINICFIEKLKSIFHSFEFIAFGDDFLIGKGCQLKDIVLSSSGVELWIFPFDSHEEIKQKLKQLIYR